MSLAMMAHRQNVFINYTGVILSCLACSVSQWYQNQNTFSIQHCLTVETGHSCPLIRLSIYKSRAISRLT